MSFGDGFFMGLGSRGEYKSLRQINIRLVCGARWKVWQLLRLNYGVVGLSMTTEIGGCGIWCPLMEGAVSGAP